jgi:hypothetical protein
VADFSHRDILGTLRKFPESRVIYQKMREVHEAKVAERLALARIPCEVERLRFLREKQPWVLKVAPENLVAGYLGMGRERLRELMRIGKL